MQRTGLSIDGCRRAESRSCVVQRGGDHFDRCWLRATESLEGEFGNVRLCFDENHTGSGPGCAYAGSQRQIQAEVKHAVAHQLASRLGR